MKKILLLAILLLTMPGAGNAGDVLTTVQDGQRAALSTATTIHNQSTDPDTGVTVDERYAGEVRVPQGTIQFAEEIGVQTTRSLIATSTFFNGLGGQMKSDQMMTEGVFSEEACNVKGVSAAFRGLSVAQESVFAPGPNAGITNTFTGRQTFRVVEQARTMNSNESLNHVFNVSGNVTGVELGYRNADAPAADVPSTPWYEGLGDICPQLSPWVDIEDEEPVIEPEPAPEPGPMG